MRAALFQGTAPPGGGDGAGEESIRGALCGGIAKCDGGPEASGPRTHRPADRGTGRRGESIDGYGKGAIVGAAGELEHGALWHVPGGYAMRERLGEAKAIVPSAKKVGALGCRLDVPIGHINAAYVRSHFDAMEVGIGDGPRPDEILFCLAMTTGPRIHARMGGLATQDVKGEDGLR